MVFKLVGRSEWDKIFLIILFIKDDVIHIGVDGGDGGDDAGYEQNLLIMIFHDFESMCMLLGFCEVTDLLICVLPYLYKPSGHICQFGCGQRGRAGPSDSGHLLHVSGHF